MRKAGLKGRSRRKAANSSNGNSNNSSSNSSSDGTHNGGGSNGMNGEVKRKQTQEEVALQAKNYRLAKELSEMRVRHRDETKTVTRLTMENMNLATRCREAINQATMLKRELIICQRKAAEAIAMQKHQMRIFTEQGKHHVSHSSTSVFSTSTMSLPETAHQNSDQTQNSHHIPQDQLSFSANTDQSTFATFQSSRGIGTQGRSEVPQFDNISPKQQQLLLQQQNERPTAFNKKSSIKNSFSISRHRNEIANAPLDELSHRNAEVTTTNSPNSMPAADFFHPTPPILPATPEREAIEIPNISQLHHAASEKMVNNNFHSIDFSSTNKTNNHHTHENSQLNHSSIEAFEASFDTTFPSAFSVSKEDQIPQGPTFDVSEFSDPFFIGRSYGNDDEHKSESVFEFEPNIEKSNNEKGRHLTSQMSKTSLNKSTEFSSVFHHANRNGEHNPSFLSLSVPHDEPSDIPISSSAAKSSASTTDTQDMKPPSMSKSTENTDAFNGFDSSSMDLFPPSAMGTFDFMSEGKTSMYQHDVTNKSDTFNNIKTTVPNSKSSPRATKKTLPHSRTQYATVTPESTSPENNNTNSSSRSSATLQQHHQRSGAQGNLRLDEPNTLLQSQPDQEGNQSPTVVIRRLHQRRAQEKVMKNSGADFKNVVAPDSSYEGLTDPGDLPLETRKPVKVKVTSSTNKSSTKRNPPPKSSDVIGHSNANFLEGKETQNLISEKENTNSTGTDINNIPESSSSSKTTESKISTDQSTQIKSTSPKMHKLQNEETSYSNETGPTPPFSDKDISIETLPVITPTSASTKMTPTNASSSTPTPTSSSRRRAVRQPVSYAEPSLNSKLRRGDVFFPKKERMAGDSEDDGLGIQNHKNVEPDAGQVA